MADEGKSGDGPKLSKKELSKMEKNRKKDVRASDSDLSISSDGSDSDTPKEKLTFFQMLKSGLTGVGKYFAKGFLDYGPPYFPHKDGVEREPCPVCDCVSEMNMSYIKLHRLLNEKNDPNIADKDDLYNRAMHWCGRHLHFLAARMLRRAGAEVNVVNEMGQTPLLLVAMNTIAHEKDPRRKRQFQLLEWLVEQGASIHHRDKGGYEALDFACMNNDLDLIEALVDLGAKFRRDNISLVAKRKSLLGFISDPDVYKYVLEKLTEEEEAFQQRESMNKARKEELAYEKGVQKNLMDLAKKKLEKEQRKKEALDFELKMAKQAEREKNIAAAMRSLTVGKKARDAEFGEWVSDEAANWTWKPSSTRKGDDAVARDIHAYSVREIRKLNQKNKKSLYEDRWRAMGGEGKIEVPWTRGDEFCIEGITDEASTVVDEFSVDVSDDLAFRDENDDLLDGESLDSLDDLF
jgi:hypothetical protein